MNPPIEIVRPCTADWNAMTGDDRRRLCARNGESRPADRLYFPPARA